MLASVTAERTTEQLGLSRLDAEGKASEWLEAANSHESTQKSGYEHYIPRYTFDASTTSKRTNKRVIC